jgi:preprotein translocase subunit SecE
MTAIEKANELIVKALIKFERLTLIEAKKIVLMTVDEMINELEILRIEDIDYKKLMLRYWQEVKQEIEKL